MEQRPRPQSGRLLGLDVGDRRIGVSISDPDQRLAVSLPTLERERNGGEVRELRELARRDEIAGIVVGLPLGLSGEKGPQAEKTEAYAKDLERTVGLPVYLYDERLSTREALNSAPSRGRGERRDRGRPARVDADAIAATIILQAFLDSLRYERSD